MPPYRSSSELFLKYQYPHIYFAEYLRRTLFGFDHRRRHVRLIQSSNFQD